jgi:ketosteroid isomerase-like protein
MGTDATRTALDALLAAFAEGDNDRLAALYDDDVDWLFHCPASMFPFAGRRRGKASVFQGFALFYRDYKLVRYDVVRMLVDGEHAALMSDVHSIQRSTGRTMRSHIAGFHRFRDGRLIEYRGFTDSFDAVEQILGRELEV